MYEEIPDLNLFMVCEVPKKEAFACLPEGYYLIHAGGMSLTCGKECLSTRKNRRKRFSAI